MAKPGSRNILFITFLFIAGVVAALTLWFFVFLPIRMMESFAFTPLAITEEDFASAKRKLEVFRSEKRTLILTREESGALLKQFLEAELDFEIPDILLRFEGEHQVTALFRSKITEVPSTGLFSYMTRKSGTEYTTTLLNARVSVDEGNLSYRIDDFRIGRIKIPSFLISRITRGTRSFSGIHLKSIHFRGDILTVERTEE